MERQTLNRKIANKQVCQGIKCTCFEWSNRLDTALYKNTPLAKCYPCVPLLQVQKLKGKLTKSEELTMQQKSKLLAKQVEDTRNELRDGGGVVIRGKYFMSQ